MAKKKAKKGRVCLRVCFCDETAKKNVKRICRRLGKVKKDTASLLVEIKRKVPALKARRYLEAQKPQIVSVEVVRKKATKKNKAPR